MQWHVRRTKYVVYESRNVDAKEEDAEAVL